MIGLAAVLAGSLFGAALALLTAFFVTQRERYDRWAEWCFVAFAITAVPTIVATASAVTDGGFAIVVSSALGLVGVIVLGLAELGSTLGRVDFRRAGPIVAVAFLAFLIWIGAVSILSVTRGGLPAGLGWLGIASIAVGIGVMAWIAATGGMRPGQGEPSRAQMIAFLAPTAGIVAWLIWLGLSL